jgi:aminobenzoyl-glutamate utilization protein B
MDSKILSALRIIEQKKELICKISDQIWDHPETAFEEFVSAGILCDALEKEGFAVTRGLAGIETAFSGRYGSGKPVIGILGAFDVPFSNMNQPRQLCQRSAHTRGSRPRLRP